MDIGRRVLSGAGCSPGARCRGQGNDFELIQTARTESRHAIEGPLGHEFSSIYIVRKLSPSEVGSRWQFYRKIYLFGKNDPLQEDFQNFVPKGFTTSQIHVLCANFMKFGRLEVGKVVHLHNKKTRFRLARSHFCEDHAQNPPGLAANNVLRVPQISSK